MVADDVARYLAQRRELVARIEKVNAAITLHDDEQTRRLKTGVPEVRELQAAAMARVTLVKMRQRLERDLAQLDGNEGNR